MGIVPGDVVCSLGSDEKAELSCQIFHLALCLLMWPPPSSTEEARRPSASQEAVRASHDAGAVGWTWVLISALSPPSGCGFESCLKSLSKMSHRNHFQ